VRSDVSTPTNQRQQQEDLPLLPEPEQQQPKALALKQRSSAKLAAWAALPAPLQQGLQTAATALQPARQAVSAVLDKFDPRVRGLILLNIMTLVMGSNWVVVKESNDAFDPVSA
jgi:hypothetical protein